jgi:hypothetical protein
MGKKRARWEGGGVTPNHVFLHLIAALCDNSETVKIVGDVES